MNIMTTLKKMKMKILWGAQGAFGKRKILCENKFLQAIWSVQPWPCRNECFPLEFQCLCKIDKQRVFIQEEKHHYTISMVIPFLIKVLCNGYFCKPYSLLNTGLQNSCGLKLWACSVDFWTIQIYPRFPQNHQKSQYVSFVTLDI